MTEQLTIHSQVFLQIAALKVSEKVQRHLCYVSVSKSCKIAGSRLLTLLKLVYVVDLNFISGFLK